MNTLRVQRRYEFCPPRYSPWFRPILHLLCMGWLRHRFNIRTVRIRGVDSLVKLVRDRQSVLVAPNHADHVDPGLFVHTGRLHGIAFHFMAAREAFECSRLNRFVLQRSGAFSIDREGVDLASIKTAMNILRECKHPLVIFPEGEIYHHHEELDVLNDGVATILLRAAEKLPEGKRSYVIPTAIRLTHDPSVADTFSPRLGELEKRITWKPRPGMDVVERIYSLGSALLSVKEEEFMGESQKGPLITRIQNLQRFLVEQVEKKHGLTPGVGCIPARIKAVRQVIRKELTAEGRPLSREREEELYDELDRVFAAQQLYSYPGQYVRQNPTIDRIAETVFKLEEDVFGKGTYPAPRTADVVFGEPVDVQEFLESTGRNVKTGIQPMTELLRHRIGELLSRSAASEAAPVQLRSVRTPSAPV